MLSRGRAPDHIADPGKEARAKSGIPVVPAFDGFRAFAILGVVAIHLAQISGVSGDGTTFGSQLVWGTLGRTVEVLFVVSGFVVFLPTVARRGSFGSIRGFMIRRAARLLPAYWLALLVCLMLIAFFNLPNPLVPGLTLPLPDLRDIVLNVTALEVPARMFTADAPIGFGLDTPMWTLSSELIFYLFLPVVAVAFFKRPRVGLLLAALLTLGWTLAFDHVGDLARDLGAGLGLNEAARLSLAADQQFPAWAFSFGLGMAGATVWMRLTRHDDQELVRRRAGWVTLAALVATLVCAVKLGDYGAWTRTSLLGSMIFSAALATLMVGISLGPGSVQKPFAAPRVRKLGDISYGVYLIHFPIIALILTTVDLAGLSDLGRFTVLAVITVPAALIYGYLSARFLEQPIRRWARRYSQRGEG
jgi:peptidoglycan/LPS O-acetylase OafA/YrhL